MKNIQKKSKKIIVFALLGVVLLLFAFVFAKIKAPLVDWLHEKYRQHVTMNFHIIKQDKLPATNGIPRIYITTNNGRMPFTLGSKQKATCTITGKKGNIKHEGVCTIKGRGNSTWKMPKKPYTLKLKTATSLLGFPKSKKFVLLNSYPDKTLIRSCFAFHIAKNIYTNLKWTPQCQNVELVINGIYLGVYQLCEGRTIEKSRLDLPKGSYLLEVDRPEENVIILPSSVKVNVKEPEDLSKEQFSSIKQKIFALDSAICHPPAHDFCGGLLDLKGTVDWYIVNEFTKNHDAFFRASVYFYWHSKKQKFFFGPVWDFDLSCGNYDHDFCQFPEGLHIKNKWAEFWLLDPNFKTAVKNRWNETKSSLLFAIDNFIDEQAQYIKTAQQWNFKAWDILNENVWPNYVVKGSFLSEVNYMKDFLKTRYIWLDSEFNSF